MKKRLISLVIILLVAVLALTSCDEIVDKVVNHVKLARAGLTAKYRPLGVFGFLGKSGTGKTEHVKERNLNIFSHYIQKTQNG